MNRLCGNIWKKSSREPPSEQRLKVHLSRSPGSYPSKFALHFFPVFSTLRPVLCDRAPARDGNTPPFDPLRLSLSDTLWRVSVGRISNPSGPTGRIGNPSYSNLPVSCRPCSFCPSLDSPL